MTQIILASKSPYRKELLNKLDIEFTTCDSKIDESAYKKKISDPTALSQKLAWAKAQNIFKDNSESLVIGSDQVCSFENELLGKSGSLEKSFEQLKKLQGKTHRLLTSYCILFQDKAIERTVSTELTMRNLSDIQIKKYLSLDNPIDCAGSYKLELNGIGLMKNIATSDYTAIIGLPLVSLANDLEHLGTLPFNR